MLYSVVEIKKRVYNEDDYIVVNYELPDDREEFDTPDHDRMEASLGYYVYPREMGIENATLKLKLAMIKARQEQIRRLENSIFNISMV